MPLNYDYCYTSSRLETCPCVIIILFYLFGEPFVVNTQVLALIHTLPPLPVCVCVKIVLNITTRERFSFSIFFSSLLSLLFAEKPKSERKSWFFFTTHKTFRFNFAFRFRHNPFLSCFQTHFPNPVRKTFFSHWLSPLARGNAKRKFLHGFKYGPGEKVYGAELNRPKTRSRLTCLLRGRERREQTLFVAKGNPRHPAFRHQHRQPGSFPQRERQGSQPKGCLYGDFERAGGCVCACGKSLTLSREGK